MRIVIQRVLSASVDVEGRRIAESGKGILVLLGVEKGDGEEQAKFLASKIANMRIFEDENGRMNLHGAGKGRRPSFDTAAEPDHAGKLFDVFSDSVVAEGITVARGAFREHMHVSLVNDGPVTFVLEA